MRDPGSPSRPEPRHTSAKEAHSLPGSGNTAGRRANPAPGRDRHPCAVGRCACFWRSISLGFRSPRIAPDGTEGRRHIRIASRRHHERAQHSPAAVPTELARSSAPESSDLRAAIPVSRNGSSGAIASRNASITTAALLGHQRYSVALLVPARSAMASAVTWANAVSSIRSKAALRIRRRAASSRGRPLPRACFCGMAMSCDNLEYTNFETPVSTNSEQAMRSYWRDSGMWIVRVALARPYTFIVLALLILILAPVVILRTPTDIFPNIDIPVIAAAFNYTGLSAEEMEERITSIYERSLTTTVNDIEHIESQSINGRAIIKVFFQPGADINAAVAQVSAISQPILRQLPPGAIAAVSAHLQRLERAHHATRPLRARTERAGAVRLRRQLHPHAPGDHSGLRDSLSVRRQAAPDHGRYQSRGHAVQRALAGRRHQQPSPTRTSSSRRAPRRSASSNTMSI